MPNTQADPTLLSEVRLRYSTDSKPGITRLKHGESFSYHDREGKEITDDATLERIKKLVIPPAWERVWISPIPNGHLQAVGYDSKGRKQYRYHSRWNTLSSEQKFLHLSEFAETLPKVRRKVREHMGLSGMPKEKVIATVVWLLEHTLIRVGNEEYQKENNSYGLTTLKNRHTTVKNGSVQFAFKGKSGVFHNVNVTNKRVAAIIRKCHDLPGQDLFTFLDANGNPDTITSEEVNEYLKEVSGKEITAKDFRTWGGTNLAAKTLDKIGIATEEAEIKHILTDTVKSVASHLRNKPATSRKYYIHPVIFEAYTQGYTISNITEHKKYVAEKMLYELDDCENNVICMLKVFSNAYQQS